MPAVHETASYPIAEERINVVSHAMGLLFSVAALVLLVLRANGAMQTVSVAVFASSMIALYAASTIYHSADSAVFRAWMRTVDHAMIYVLIAGTYTPFTLVVLQGALGWSLFGLTWAMAATGIVLKLFHTGRYDRLSTAMYVFMGWIIIFAIKPLIASLSAEGLIWLFAGGIAYTVGALFYSLRAVPYGHAIFHVFVIAGSTCHFVSVYFFVLVPISS